MMQYLHPGGGDTRSEIAKVPARLSSPKSRTTRVVGYVVAALVIGAMLWVVNHLVGWGWPPFLTSAFEDLLPWVNVSLAATVAVNLLWTWRDPAWFKHLARRPQRNGPPPPRRDPWHSRLVKGTSSRRREFGSEPLLTPPAVISELEMGVDNRSSVDGTCFRASREGR
jgi:hypothetical protein